MPRFEVVEQLPDEALVLSLRGRDGVVRDYTIEPVDAETWYRFSALGQVFEAARNGYEPAKADAEAVEKLTEELGAMGLQRKSLGDEVVKAMLADGVSGPDFRRAYTTALVWHTAGGETEKAMEVWNAGKAPASKPTPTTVSTTTTDTAEAKRIPSPDSGTGTTSRPKRTPKAKA